MKIYIKHNIFVIFENHDACLKVCILLILMEKDVSFPCVPPVKEKGNQLLLSGLVICSYTHTVFTSIFIKNILKN